jgi:aromatic ring hydroxylase
MATPTTLPATFVAGNVLTAAQMNDLRGAFRVLQVVTTEKTDTFSTTSTSFVDVTGVSVSITPSATSSKVLVLVQFVGGSNGSGGAQRVNLVRGSTNIAQSTGGITNQTQIFYTAGSATTTCAIAYLDSPSTTSATTYKLQTAVDGSATVFVGRRPDVDQRAITTITALEISA